MSQQNGDGVWAQLAILAVVVFVIVKCSGHESHDWKAWIYPDRADLSRSVAMGSFKSFEQCQGAAVDALRVLNLEADGDYECGSDCKFKPDLGINVCKETRK
jgi:hypothetical protein